MLFKSVISDNPDPILAAEKICQEVLEGLQGNPCHAAFLFISSQYRNIHWAETVKTIYEKLSRPVMIGCSSGGVIGHNQEIEASAGIALIAAYLPGVKIEPLYISPEELSISTPGLYWQQRVKSAQAPNWILIADPHTSDVMKIITEWGETFRQLPLVGGLASGAPPLKKNYIIMNNQIFREGAVALAMSGNIRFETIVSQGCRPVGKTYRMTKAHRNLLQELDGKNVESVLNELFNSLPEQDQLIAQHALFLGIAVDARRPYFERGDFLIRNILGLDQETGGIVIGEHGLTNGLVAQFHIRDAKAAEEDFRILLELNKMGHGTQSPAGGLLFSCLGRGAGLFGKSNHDIELVKEITGDYPIAGFFCNGEIGPIGGKTYIHGYTSCLGIFMPEVTDRV